MCRKTPNWKRLPISKKYNNWEIKHKSAKNHRPIKRYTKPTTKTTNQKAKLQTANMAMITPEVSDLLPGVTTSISREEDTQKISKRGKPASAST